MLKLYAALITPFDENGKPSQIGFKELTSYLRSAGVRGFVVNGTTGLFPYLDKDERKKCVDYVLNYSDKDDEIIVCVGHSNYNQVIELIKYCEKKGVETILLPPPYYIKLNRDELIEFYKRVRAETQLKIIAYNIPQLTNNPLTPDVIAFLAAEGLADGVKDTSGVFQNFQKTIILTDKIKGFKRIIGDDYLTLASLIIGGDGAILGSANIIPGLWIELYNCLKNGDISRAVKLQKEANKIIDAMFIGSFPTAIYYILKELNINCGLPRFPLKELSENEVASLKNVLKNFNQHKIT
ncbi:MAG: dihydrodipicolinate synthase family protein [Candidatus Odinarchaeum yellowstonii]|jgi:dihydrodipicolinate synthase/N-acetylneuraminate lyase|uniref:Dihydrodipicolinate synthase family protein n=1 Tax=Odinarchaeota yellowstonii (strain LCB_4) TaxID=1841599 RepID=A0AAF0IB12_ODILC|nr:MAG: dihydrodipicolinate synthase family protein [Candidatus Odinarchaeum yellowstonii]